MEKFDFISEFILQFFTNAGVRTITVFSLGAFGFLCLYHILTGFIFKVRKK